MKSKVLNLIFAFALCTGGCSMRELDLPVPSPMPVRKAPEVDPTSSCLARFNPSMNFSEVALTAIKMRKRCGLSQQKILELAKKL